MTKAQAAPLCDALEAAGFPYMLDVDTAGNHTVTLRAARLSGKEMLSLMNVLAPGGVPIPGIEAKLEGVQGFTVA